MDHEVGHIIYQEHFIEVLHEVLPQGESELQQVKVKSTKKAFFIKKTWLAKSLTACISDVPCFMQYLIWKILLMVKTYLVGKSMAILLYSKNLVWNVLILLHTEPIVPYWSLENVCDCCLSHVLIKNGHENSVI